MKTLSIKFYSGSNEEVKIVGYADDATGICHNNYNRVQSQVNISLIWETTNGITFSPADHTNAALVCLTALKFLAYIFVVR